MQESTSRLDYIGLKAIQYVWDSVTNTSGSDGDAAYADAVLRESRSTMAPRSTEKTTYNDAARARDGGAGALRAGANADNGDGAAGQPNERVDVADIDADALEDGSTRSGVGLESHGIIVSIHASCGGTRCLPAGCCRSKHLWARWAHRREQCWQLWRPQEREERKW